MTTRSDDNLENAGAPQNLEWVTPKISLMEAGDTEGGGKSITLAGKARLADGLNIGLGVS